MLFDTSYKFYGDSVEGTAAKGQTTIIDFMMPGTFMVYGADMIYDHATLGDYVQLQVIDKDNVLGYGENFILNTWIEKWFVPINQNIWSVTSNLAGTLPQGLYIRLTYTSVGILNDVPIRLNYRMISPT